jgi:hypothetical protein
MLPSRFRFITTLGGCLSLNLLTVGDFPLLSIFYHKQAPLSHHVNEVALVLVK